MIRSGQYSLGYLFLITFWIALAVGLGRCAVVYIAEFPSPSTLVSCILFLYGAIVCGSIAIGGFFKCMRVGALVRIATVLGVSLIGFLMLS